MLSRSWFLAAITALTIAACIAIPLIPETAQPIDATSLGGDDPAMEVLPSSQGLPMPEGLHAGDKIYLSDMSPATRSFFMVGGSNPPRGTSIDLPVRNPDGSLRHVQAQFAAVDFFNGNAINMATQAAGFALTLLTAALGLLLIWRGQSQAALGVALWCFAFFQQSVLSLIPLPVPYGNILNWIGSTLDNLGTLVGLYIVADGLTRDARTAKRRRGSRLRFGAVWLLYAIGVTAFNLHFYLHGDFNVLGTDVPAIYGVVGLHFAAFMIPLSMLLFSYRRCDPVNQARIRWVLFSLVGLLLSYVLGLVAGRLGLPIFVLNMIGTTLVAAAFVGFAYAVLKHQLVSLQVVLNRALVYGLVTSLVVGVFTAMLSFLEHETLNTETNRLLALFVPLVLGMGLDTIKRQVNTYLGKAFFRKRHEAEAALAQFARTCGHIDDTEKLLDLTADELLNRAGPQAVGIYLTSPQTSGAVISRQRGAAPCPPKLDANDLAFLRLKAGDAEVNLLSVGSVLGNDGLVYALHVRNQLLGCIYLGPRPAEAYSAEERQLFERVAHQVAVALHALRLDAQRKLLEELADGGVASLPMARAKAKELIETAN
jgi:hypothetical protein